MAAPQLPALFLSHSGEQKDFVWRLYRELLHVNHSPFFDQDPRLDSLPKGSPFPSRILDACRACKLGIVVLSHDYIESMWPMLELQQLLFHNSSSPHNVFPIFYELKPVDLCKPENLMRWKSVWESKVPVWHQRNRDQHMATPTTFQSLTLDIDSWPKALEMLRYQNGQIRPENKDNHPFIQTIVSNICKRHPPPQSFLMGDHFKGVEHIQQEIDALFQQQQQRNVGTSDACRRPISVGLYGVGGSGKTTVCKYMLNFYNKEYPGSCCFLQFPSTEEDKSQLLVQSMKDILSKHGNMAKEMLETIKSVEQAMPHVQEFLRWYKVFLILDNVWESDLLVARQIVTMDYMPGSKLLVTARSNALLRTLGSNEGLGGPPPMQIVHVPSISEEEATEALKAYSCTSLQFISNGEDLRDLARSCFFGEQCHPLFLKAMGVKLRRLGGHIRNTEDWTQLCSRLKSHATHGGEEIEDIVVNVLKTSYDALHSSRQNTFLKLGTCVPKSWPYKSLLGSSEWLSMISTAGNSQSTHDIRDQLMELEYHGLLQIYKEDIVIHDLQIMLIQNIVRNNNGEPGCFFFQGDVATLSASEWSRVKYIHGYAKDVSSSALSVFRPQTNCFPLDQRVTSPNVPGIEVLHLEMQRDKPQDLKRSLRLSVKHMQSLHHLVLDRIDMKLEVGGWHGAPKLVSVELKNCGNIQRIESMTCLQRLERFNMTNSRAMQKRSIILGNYWPISHNYLCLPPKLQELSVCDISVDMGALSASSSLQELTVEGDSKLHKLLVSNWINLRKLTLDKCERLQSIEGSVCALEELCLTECRSLESIPDLMPAGNLRRLVLLGCAKVLKEAVDMGALSASSSLQELAVQGDSKLYKLLVSNCINLRKLTLEWCERLQSIEGSVCALEELSLTKCRSPESIPDLKPAGNLRRLEVNGCEALKEVVDLGSSNIPVGLEELQLVGFGGAAIDMSTLINLRFLSIAQCPSLTRVTGLGALSTLALLWISKCESLREVGHWEAPFDTCELQSINIGRCPRLESLSTMRHLTSLTTFYIYGSPNVQRVMLPQGARGYLNGKIT